MRILKANIASENKYTEKTSMEEKMYKKFNSQNL